MLPLRRMLKNWIWTYYSLIQSVIDRIIRIGFHKKRCPEKLYGGIVLLRFINHIAERISLRHQSAVKWKGNASPHVRQSWLPFITLMILKVNVNLSYSMKTNLNKFLFTSALKMVRGAFGDMDFLSAGITDWSKQTIEIHCPRFSESPTNINLLPLNFSHTSAMFHLQKE